MLYEHKQLKCANTQWSGNVSILIYSSLKLISVANFLGLQTAHYVNMPTLDVAVFRTRVVKSSYRFVAIARGLLNYATKVIPTKQLSYINMTRETELL
jgi:hypothetical protein